MQLDKKNIKIILGLITFALILWAVLKNISTVLSGAEWLINLITPFIIGGCMAFIINIPMNFFKDTLFKPERIEKHKWLQKIKEPASMVLAILLVLVIIAAALFILIPNLINAITTISEKVPVYVQNIKTWADQLKDSYPQVAQMMVEFGINLENISYEIVNFLKDQGLTLLNHTFNAASSVAGSIVNFFIGLVFCIYCLLAKDTLTGQFRKLLYAFLKEPIADKILRVLRMASARFTGFITGQCTESVIIVVIYSIILSLCGFPYSVMIAVTIGVFSLVPIIGSLIGCIIGVLLVFLDSPSSTIWFLVVFLIVQQLETNLIYPKVLGGKVGLPSMWVLVAVIIGGNAFGILGMIAMIPIFSVIYALLADKVHVDLLKKNVSEEKLTAPDRPMRPKINLMEKFKLKRKKKEPQQTETPQDESETD